MLPPAVIDHCSSHVAALLPSDRTVTLRSLSALVRPQSVDVRRMCRVSLTGSTAHRALSGSALVAVLCCAVRCCAVQAHGSTPTPTQLESFAASASVHSCNQRTVYLAAAHFRAEQSSLDWRATGESILGQCSNGSQCRLTVRSCCSTGQLRYAQRIVGRPCQL
jgi:hypothetical protein